MHSLLLGNGINRLARQRSWNEILMELASHFGATDLIPHIATKPLSMFIEELSARLPMEFREAEYQIKVVFAGLLSEIMPVQAHERVCAPFAVIMTTNYDFTVEEAFAGPLHSPSFLAKESRYSLFRRHVAGNKEVWHVHGDIARPDSMVLGYDHYAGYLQKIRNYVTGAIDVKGPPHGKVRSPVKSGALMFRDTHKVFSWVDHFLRDHLHIVGLGLDFTEIDLWWLLLHKRRRRHRTGKVFFYQVALPSDAAESPVTSLLQSLDVEVVSIAARTYEEGYYLVAETIEARIAAYPALLSKTPLPTEERVYEEGRRRVIQPAKQREFRFPKP